MFDTDKFRKTKFKARTKDIPVPLLTEFFTDGQPAVWTVTALSTEQIAIVKEAANKNALMGEMVLAMMGGANNEKVNAMLEGMGISDDLPETLARDIEAVLYGSVNLDAQDPTHRDIVVTLANQFPSEFAKISNEIWALIGQGPEIVGKPTASTSAKK